MFIYNYIYVYIYILQDHWFFKVVPTSLGISHTDKIRVQHLVDEGVHKLESHKVACKFCRTSLKGRVAWSPSCPSCHGHMVQETLNITQIIITANHHSILSCSVPYASLACTLSLLSYVTIQTE